MAFGHYVRQAEAHAHEERQQRELIDTLRAQNALLQRLLKNERARADSAERNVAYFEAHYVPRRVRG